MPGSGLRRGQGADSTTVAAVTEGQPDSRPPRGALIVVAVGLLACVAAPLLTSEKSGGASEVRFVAEKKLPESRPANVSGSSAQMRIYHAEIRAGEVNDAGYRLYRTSAILRIDAGAPVGGARVRCAIRAPKRTVAAQSFKFRASYPRSSEELEKQPVPGNVVVNFNANGGELALLEFGDAFPEFASEPGVKVEWPAYKVGEERWNWFLPPGAPKKTLKLGFATIWRTTAPPASRIACAVTTSAGAAAVRTAGALSG
jgi:hypothetical protein